MSTNQEPVAATDAAEAPPQDDAVVENTQFTEQLFSEFALSPQTLEGISSRGYQHPTHVQSRVIEPALAGRDLIVRSKTGTGKTAAFGIPMVERARTDADKPQGLVLCPTRELAIQVGNELSALGAPRGLTTATIYGGASMQKQIDELRAGAAFVAGTPGRVLDHIRRGNLDLSGVTVRVLDEADEMLSMGFFEEVSGILRKTPDDAQTLLFSATVGEGIEELIKDFSTDAETILLSGDEFSVDGIENILYETREDNPKPRNLLYLVEAEDPPAAIIFCNTRDDTAMVTAVLNKHGLDAELINSDLSQRERERVMGRIKTGKLQFMVATDLAARGIDISDLSHVINYSLPEDPSVYMHRVGRTGRIGKSGRAISLYSGRDLHTLKALETTYGVEFDRRDLPDPEEARKHWAQRHIRELQRGMESSVFEAFLPLVREIRERTDGEYILAYALKAYFTARRRGTASPAAESQGERSDRGRGERRERGRGRDDDRERGRGRGDRDDGRERGRERGGRGRDRDARSERGGRADERSEAPAPNRLYVGIGSEDGLDADGVRDRLCEAAEAGAELVESVEVRDKFSFVNARDEEAAETLLTADGRSFGDRTLKVERAKSPGSGGRRRRRRRGG